MKRFLFTLLAIGSVCLLSAQSPVGEQVLTFDEAFYLMNSRNDRITATVHEEAAAEMEKKAAFGLRLPQIGVTGAYTYMSDDIGFNFNHAKQPIGQLVGDIAGLLPPDLGGALTELAKPLLQRSWELVLQDQSVGLVGITAQMPIYTGGKINAANNAARLQWEESREKGNQTKNALVSELAERYFGLALANQVVEVRREVLDGMEKHLHDARELETNGIIARAERLYAEMFVAEAQKELQKSIRDAGTINTALANTLNEDGNYVPVTTMFVVNDIEPVGYFKELAIEQNPQLKQVDVLEQLAREGVRAQRADFLPQVALMGGYDIYNYQLTHVAPKWVLGAGVSIKLFDGLNREYKYSAAKNQVRQVEALNHKAQSDITTLVEKIYNDMLAAGEQIGALDASLAFALEYLRAKEVAFNEGASSSSDLVDARMNLARIRTERLMAAYTYDVLLAQLLEAAGDSYSYGAYITNRPITQIRFE